MVPRESHKKLNTLQKALIALMIAFVLVLPAAQPAQAQWVVTDPILNVWETIKDIAGKAANLFKEHTALLWKQTQLYFGTRLAHDAAVAIASGNIGQGSFIWEPSELKRVGKAAVGDFLDDLSQSYFGKSACQPLDIAKQVNIDLSARSIIAELGGKIADFGTRMCEELCKETALETSPALEEIEGLSLSPEEMAKATARHAADVSEQGLFQELGAVFSKDRSSIDLLSEYADLVADLMKHISKMKNDIAVKTGSHSWDMVYYTLYGDPLDTITPLDASDQNCGLVEHLQNTDPNISNSQFQSDFMEALKDGFPPAAKADCNPAGPDPQDATIAGHDAQFAELVVHMMDVIFGGRTWGYAEVRDFFYEQGWLDKISPGSLEKGFDVLVNMNTSGAYNTKDERKFLLGTLFIYLEGDPKVGTDFIIPPVPPGATKKRGALAALRSLFAENDQLIKQGALKVKLATDINIIPILELLVAKGDQMSPADSPVAYERDVFTEIAAANPVYPPILPNTRILFPQYNGYLDTKVDEALHLPLDSDAKVEDFFEMVEVIIKIQDWFAQNGEFVDQAMGDLQRVSQCVDLCEKGKVAEPAGTCSLDQIWSAQKQTISNAKSVSGVTGTLGLGAGSIQVSDLSDFAQLGDPKNNPIGQILDIAQKSVGLEEEERRAAEVAAQANDYLPDTSIISNRVKRGGQEVGKRLDRSLEDVREKSNTYTGSILAEMWGVFFNTLLEQLYLRISEEGFQPDLSGGPFDPGARRLSAGQGVEAAEAQFSAFKNPAIRTGRTIPALQKLSSGCEKGEGERAFNECVIDDGFKQAIEKELTLGEAMERDVGLIDANGLFGFRDAQNNQPNTSLGEGISYDSMIILRKYRIIPSSWEVAAQYVRDKVLKAGKPPVSLHEIVDNFEVEDSPFFGLVDPDWVLKLPIFQCNIEGAGERIFSEVATVNINNPNGPSEVIVVRDDAYCADEVSCIKEKSDGKGCEQWGYCTMERDYWRFPSDSCDELYTTCQAYQTPRGVEGFIKSTLPQTSLCNERTAGCKGYVRSFNRLRWANSATTTPFSSRIDTLSDTVFTYSPYNFKQDFKVDLALNTTVLTDFADSGTATSLTDAGAFGGNDVWIGAQLSITLGKLKDLYATVEDNDNNTLTVRWRNIIPPSGAQYEVRNGTCANPFAGGVVYGPANITNATDDRIIHTNHSWPGGNWFNNIIVINDPGNSHHGVCGLIERQDPSIDTIYLQSTTTTWVAIPDVTTKYQLFYPEDPSINPDNFFANPEGTIKKVPVLWRCTDLTKQESCLFERVAGRKEGCILSDGTTCSPWELENGVLNLSSADKIAEVTQVKNEYWCGLPGGAGCLVSAAGSVQCSLETNNYDTVTRTWIAPPDPVLDAGGNPINCSLASQPLVYLSANAKACPSTAAGCQDFVAIDFADDTYVGNGVRRILTGQQKQEFVWELYSKRGTFFEKQGTVFDYASVSTEEIIPGTLPPNSVFEPNQVQIKHLYLNHLRRQCTKDDIECRFYYPADGGPATPAVLDPQADLCPALCVGYFHYVEPLTPIEKRLQSKLTANGFEVVTSVPWDIDRYFIAKEEDACPAQFNGCERFIENIPAVGGSIPASAKRLYLTDVRMCVKPGTAGAVNVDTYTIIESSVSGATNPLNVRLLKSSFNAEVRWDEIGGKVVVDNILAGPNVLYSQYNGPCVELNAQLGAHPDTWTCNDSPATFNAKIKPLLEGCLVFNSDTPPKPVTDLSKPECREYIYFPLGLGAERYPLLYDAPIQESAACTTFIRGESTGSNLLYNLDPSNPLLTDSSVFSCKADSSNEAKYVSCREFKGPGTVVEGPLSWVNFENASSSRWSAGGGWIAPNLTTNVNDEADTALSFAESGVVQYRYMIVPDPAYVTDSKTIFRDKNFELTAWIQTPDIAGTELIIGLQDEGGNNVGQFKYVVQTAPLTPIDYKASDNLWHPVRFNQLTPSALPVYLFIRVNGVNAAPETVKIDNIILRDSTSVYSLKDTYEFKNSSDDVAHNVPNECNTDYQSDPPNFDSVNPIPYQLNCKEYKTDRGEAITFKTPKLCKDEVVGCKAMINTFNTQSPLGQTFVAEGKTNLAQDSYFVPDDALEFWVASPEAQCSKENVGCALLGKPYYDERGMVAGFNETTLIDDPSLYTDPNSPLACTAEAQGCEVFKMNESSAAAYTIDPVINRCQWVSATDLQNTGLSAGWYKRKLSGGYEQCAVNNVPVYSEAQKKVTRPLGHCVEIGTNRAVVDPKESIVDVKTAWCTTKADCTAYDVPLSNNPNTGIDLFNKVKCVSTAGMCPAAQSQCTLFMDPLAVGNAQYYFQINNNKVSTGGCGDRVSDRSGCRLFNDTSINQQTSLIFNADASDKKKSTSTLCNKPECYDSSHVFIPPPNTPPGCVESYTPCDSNRIVKVDRDRSCGEWLACQSSVLVKTGTNESTKSICLQRAPCDSWAPSGECGNFLTSAPNQINQYDVLPTNPITLNYNPSAKANLNRLTNLSGMSKIKYVMGPTEQGKNATYITPDGYSQSFTQMQENGQALFVYNSDFERFVEKASIGFLGRAQEVESKIKEEDLVPSGWIYGNECLERNCKLQPRFVKQNDKQNKSENVFEGNFSLMINGGEMMQTVSNAIPNTTYVVSAWIKMTSKGQDAKAGIYLTDSTSTKIAYGIEQNCRSFDSAVRAGNSCITTKERTGRWQYLSGTFTKRDTAGNVRIILSATDTTVFFDQVQVRSHVNVGDTYISASCRLYPESSSLTCDSHDKRGYQIRGWRGYCLERDPRKQPPDAECVNWYPVDMIQGETSVLAPIEGGEYTLPTPLYQCAESMDKMPGMPMPRLVCLARNSGKEMEKKYEGCSVVALATDPKPKFYSINKNSWIFGIDPLRMANAKDGTLYAMSMRMGDPNLCLETGDCGQVPDSVLCLAQINEDGTNVPTKWGERDTGADTGCIHGCLGVDGLGSWGSDQYIGGDFFEKRGNEKNFAGCVHDTWPTCYKRLKEYYHKISIFAFAAYKGNYTTGDKKKGFCQGDEDSSVAKNIYKFVGGTYASPLDFDLDRKINCTQPAHGWEQPVKTWGSSLDPTCGPPDAYTYSPTTPSSIPPNTDPFYQYYRTFDNMYMVTRGYIANRTQQIQKQKDEFNWVDGAYILGGGVLGGVIRWFTRPDPKPAFFITAYPDGRQTRPQQCNILVQTVNEVGDNRVWSDKFLSNQALDTPFAHTKNDPQCVPYGSAPFLRSPADIAVQPKDPETQSLQSAVNVPLDLYHPENADNDNKAQLCKNTNRGEGYYAAGGLQTICVGGRNRGEACFSDGDCEGGGRCGYGLCGNVVTKQYAPHPNRKCYYDAQCKRCDGGDRDKSMCTFDADCAAGGGTCGGSSQDCLVAQSDPLVKLSGANEALLMYEQFMRPIEVPNNKYPEGLHRIEDIFAKVYRVFKWRTEINQQYEGLVTGAYEEQGTPPPLDGVSLDVTDVISYCAQFKNLPVPGNESACNQQELCKWETDCVPDAPDYKDYNYCFHDDGYTGCSSDRCLDLFGAGDCIPKGREPFPYIEEINFDRGELTKGNNYVDLSFKTNTHSEHLPIRTVVIDWADCSQTTLTGLSWSDGERTFKHFYKYYGVEYSPPPPPPPGGNPAVRATLSTECKAMVDAACKDRGGRWECWYIPQIKVIDNWGWCNGTNDDGTSSSVKGHRFGYYGDGCFAPTLNAVPPYYPPDKPYTWTRGDTTVRVHSPPTLTNDQPPAIDISFYYYYGEGGIEQLSFSLLDLTKSEDYYYYMKVSCIDDLKLDTCRLEDTQIIGTAFDRIHLENLDSINNELASRCVGENRCEWNGKISFVVDQTTLPPPPNLPAPPAIWEWNYKIIASDGVNNPVDTGNKKIELIGSPNEPTVSVASPTRVVQGTPFTLKLRCTDDAQITDCKLINMVGPNPDIDCLASLTLLGPIQSCELNSEPFKTECIVEVPSCRFANVGLFQFNGQVMDSAGNVKTTSPIEIIVEPAGLGGYGYAY